MAERYKIYEKLGSGGLGAVFRAYDNELKRWVAIKRLMSANDASDDAKLASELRREADALASLRNPNIVTIYDVASDDEGLFMVMELLEGEDLASILARGPLHYDDFKELASQTLEALLAAHQRHILHRDIKPENIKIERLPGGRLQSKLIDFGLARAGMKARKQTEDQEGTVMGSIFYMAPEQLTRAPVDNRTDLYSLGCVFYEAISGRKAFDGETMSEVIDRHINHDLIPLSLVAPHVPPWLGAWVLRLMAQKPDDRPVDAQQAIEELRAWEKSSAPPSSTPWMPPSRGYTELAPDAYPPRPPGGYPPVVADAVPVQPVIEEEPVFFAQPIPEEVPAAEPIIEMAAQTTAISRPTPTPRPTTSVRQTPQPKPAHTPARLITEDEDSGSKNGLWIGIGAVALLAVGGLVWWALSGNKSSSDSSSSSSAASEKATPAVQLEAPVDRVAPPEGKDLTVHLMATSGAIGSNGKLVPVGSKVVEWHDHATRGQDNFLSVYETKGEHAPRRTVWPKTSPKGDVLLPNRNVLDFHPHTAKKPIALVMSSAGNETEEFPFGASSTRGEKGLTLAIVFQASLKQLPTRILTLDNNSGAQTVLRVDAKKRVVAEFRNGSAASFVTSRDVDASEPCVAILTWQANNGNVELRVQDATGRNFKAGGKVTAPTQSLNRLQIGRAGDSQPGEQFQGYLAELLIYSSVLKNDQIQSLESQVLRDYYLEPAK